METMYTKQKWIMIFIFLVALMINYPPVFASAEGWKYMSNFPGSYNSPTFAHNGYFYNLQPDGYERAIIQPNGTLSNWTGIFWSSNNLPYIGYPIATTSKMYYSTGGGSNLISYPPDNRVTYGGFNPDETLTNPIIQNNPRMLTPRELHAALILNGNLYCFGGYSTNDPPNGSLSSVEFGSINMDSTVGPFQYTSSFSRISGAVNLAWNWGNNVYCLGTDPSQSTTYIETSILQPNGTLGPWSPIGNIYNFTGPAVLTSRTTLFLIQSSVNMSGNPSLKTMINPVNNSVNNWLSAPHTLTNRPSGTIGTWDRFVYWLGGYLNGAIYTTEYYDPDLADTGLFPDANIIHLDSHDIKVIQLGESELNE